MSEQDNVWNQINEAAANAWEVSNKVHGKDPYDAVAMAGVKEIAGFSGLATFGIFGIWAFVEGIRQGSVEETLLGIVLILGAVGSGIYGEKWRRQEKVEKEIFNFRVNQRAQSLNQAPKF